MEYRRLPHGGEKISVIGLGMGYIHEGDKAEIEKTVRMAVDAGINYFDMAAAEIKPYECYGRVFSECRDEVYLQMHFGAVYDDGKYGWTTDPGKINRNFENLLRALRTDHTDMGFIHCLDEESDLEKVMTNGVWDNMLALKADGTIRHLGVSTHSPDILRRFIDTGKIDMAMFSINPAYDYTQGKYAIGEVSERMELYQRCLKEGIGISVMKPFGGGQLLDAKLSPFRRALTKFQCIQYALDRPAVMTVLPGVRGSSDLGELLAFTDAPQEEKDYSLIGRFTPRAAEGICVYCNHCQPCPAGIDVGTVNKYYDLARTGDDMAADHYLHLAVGAEACIRCGHCEDRCPFHVKQESRMKEIAAYFAAEK